METADTEADAPTEVVAIAAGNSSFDITPQKTVVRKYGGFRFAIHTCRARIVRFEYIIERMRYLSLFGWGFLIYAAMYFLFSILGRYDLMGGDASVVAGLFMCVVLSLAAGLSLRARSVFDVLPYSISWAFVMAAMDGFLSVPVFGLGAMLDWHLWIGYSIVALVPLAAPLLQHAASSRGMSVGL